MVTHGRDLDETVRQIKEENRRQLEWIKENLSYARESMDPVWRYERIATLMDGGARTVQDFFTAKRKPDLDTVVGISHALGVKFYEAALPPAEFRKLYPPKGEGDQ
jgi:hypothetical protein